MKPQVEKEAYFSRDYDTKARFSSYWHQIDEVLRLNPGRVLEIGLGNGFVSGYLRSRRVRLFTIDIDRRLRPDVTGTVLRLPFADKSFDVVICCEILEHIPYDSFSLALSEVHRDGKALHPFFHGLETCLTRYFVWRVNQDQIDGVGFETVKKFKTVLVVQFGHEFNIL